MNHSRCSACGLPLTASEAAGERCPCCNTRLKKPEPLSDPGLMPHDAARQQPIWLKLPITVLSYLVIGVFLAAFGYGVFLLTRWLAPEGYTSRFQRERQYQQMQDMAEQVERVNRPFIQKAESENRKRIKLIKRMTELIPHMVTNKTAKAEFEQASEELKFLNMGPQDGFSKLAPNAQELADVTKAYFDELRRLSNTVLKPRAVDKP